MNPRYVLAIILLLSGFFSCRNSSEKSRKTENPIPLKQQILALGDSYTIGEGVAPSETWVARLQSLLANRGYVLEDPVIVAKTGWTTDELLEGMNSANLKGPYNMVTLLIGVNNQYRGRDTAEYRGQFRVLLQQAIELAGNDPKKVVVISIPDYSVTPFAENLDRDRISLDIDLFNSINQYEAHRLKTQYAYITPSSRKAKDDSTMLAGDGLHPSARMYGLWAEQLMSKALLIFGKK